MNGGRSPNSPAGKTNQSIAAAPRALPCLLRLADEEKALLLARDRPHGVEQVGAEDDIGVHEAPERKASDAVRQAQGGVEPRRAALAQLEAGNVLDVELAGRFCHVAEQDHLDAERAPALDGAALERAHLALERLRHGEQRQHRSE